MTTNRIIHFFDVDIAAKLGVNAAIIYQNILHWVTTNKIDGRNFRDGKTWTYNSARKWKQTLFYLSEKEIRYALGKLVDNGIIIRANYNQYAFDKTIWYALADENVIAGGFRTNESVEEGEKCEIEQKNRFDKSAVRCYKRDTRCDKKDTAYVPFVTPIPDIESDINTNKESLILLSEVETSNERVIKNKFYDEDSPEMMLTQLLWKNILLLNRNYKQPNFQKWAHHVHLLIKDGNEPREIEKVINWVAKDSFWCTNILSTEKLRKQYGQLTIKRNGAEQPKGSIDVDKYDWLLRATSTVNQ